MGVQRLGISTGVQFKKHIKLILYIFVAKSEIWIVTGIKDCELNW